MVYKFRVILDVKEDVFRDIMIQGEATLEAISSPAKPNDWFITL